MQQMMLTVRPTSDFEVPSSTGYQLYSALLAVMRSSNPEASGRVHDSEIGAIAVSGLSGTFGRVAKRPGNKMLYSGQTYRFHIGITDPAGIETLICKSSNTIPSEPSPKPPLTSQPHSHSRSQDQHSAHRCG
jgi:hypothetical protein